MSETESGYAHGKTLYGYICDNAEQRPEQPAIIEPENGTEKIMSWAKLRNAVDNMADTLADLGVTEKSRIVVALPNSLGAVVSTLGAWRLGACVFFLSYELVSTERKALLEQVQPALVISTWKNLAYKTLPVPVALDYSFNTKAAGREDIVSCPARAMATGGSTGMPKIILDEVPLVYGAEDFAQWEYVTGQHPGQTLLTCGSLHHSLFNNSFYLSMAMGNTSVLMKHFSEAETIKAIAKYKVNSIVLVPTMMSRILRSKAMDGAKLDSLESVLHAGAACPAWLKRDWIKLLGAQKIHKFYSMSEKVGMTSIRGDEWLQHQGSVGRCVGAEIQIRDDKMQPLPRGTVGNVYFVSDKPRTTRYLTEERSFEHSVSVGDLGYLDAEGYLYLVDRRSDMIVSGGKNIYVTEVENALREYPLVRDIVVVGLPDAAWGRHVHAIIEPDCPAESFGIYEFASFAFRKLSSFKLPKTMELVEKLPRDESGKIRRTALAQERAEREPEGMISVPNGHQILAWRAKREKK